MITFLNMTSRVLTTALAAAGVVLPLLDAQAADQRMCLRLETQLAAVGRSAPDAQRYERAIRTQERELAKLRSQLSDMDCSGFIASIAGRCQGLKQSQARMENNLAELRATRDGMGGASAQRDRARLAKAISDAGCRAPSQVQPVAAAGAFPDAPGATPRQADKPSASRPNTSDAVADKAADAARKTGLRPAPKDGFSVFAGNTPAPAAPQPEPVAPVEPLRVPRLSDSLDSAASLAAAAAQDASATPGVERETQTSSVAGTAPAEMAYPADRKVRVVGPVFLPDPEEALDLRSPGRTAAR